MGHKCLSILCVTCSQGNEHDRGIVLIIRFVLSTSSLCYHMIIAICLGTIHPQPWDWYVPRHYWRSDGLSARWFRKNVFTFIDDYTLFMEGLFNRSSYYIWSRIGWIFIHTRKQSILKSTKMKIICKYTYHDKKKTSNPSVPI